MIGRIIGGVIGGAVGRRKQNHPIAGAVIGAGAMFAARRLFPARYAALAATAAAGYLTKKWAERREAEARASEAAEGVNPNSAAGTASPARQAPAEASVVTPSATDAR